MDVFIFVNLRLSVPKYLNLARAEGFSAELPAQTLFFTLPTPVLTGVFPSVPG